MTKDEIIKLAREAGFTGCLLPEEADNLIGGVFIDDENWAKPLERFAALVSAHEREECAQIARKASDNYEGAAIAAAIRARGETK